MVDQEANIATKTIANLYPLNIVDSLGDVLWVSDAGATGCAFVAHLSATVSWGVSLR